MNLKEMNQKSPELPIKDFIRIQNIFTEKNWPIEDFFEDNVFENFCQLLAGLNFEQRDLLLSLTENFLWVQESEYVKYFSKVFHSFITSYVFSRGKKIYFCPLLPEEDFGKSKSSVSLLYFIKAHLRAMQCKYTDFQITYVDAPNLVDVDLIKQEYTLCLIDDFIGTGETVISATKYFLDRKIEKDMMAIISLVSMKEGISKLAAEGYNTYTNICCEKGLSVHRNASQIDLMKALESNIKVAEDYRFGYGGSESLVRMMRTPNNTFPIYWLRNKKNKFAPFPR